jgi:hypothetical protein
MVNARNEITQVVRPRKVSRKIDPDWGEEVHKSILLNKKKNTLAKQSRHKEFVISNGILAFTKREEKLLNHIGIRAFLAIMRGNGLLGTSIELSLKNLSIWMNSFGE